MASADEWKSLVERLRDEPQRLSASSLDNGCPRCGVASNIAEEAADEIKRLEQELDAARDAQQSTETKLAWLVEVSSDEGPLYWGRTPDGDFLAGCTTHHDDAMQFVRQQDAQLYIDEAGWTEAKPVEHMWVGRARQFQSDLTRVVNALDKIIFDWDGEPEDIQEAREALSSLRGSGTEKETDWCKDAAHRIVDDRSLGLDAVDDDKREEIVSTIAGVIRATGEWAMCTGLVLAQRHMPDAGAARQFALASDIAEGLTAVRLATLPAKDAGKVVAHLELIEAMRDQTLITAEPWESAERAYSAGANRAFEQAADHAREALSLLRNGESGR